MSYYIEISIFGKVSDPEPIHDLAEAVSNEEGLDDAVDIDKFATLLENASSRGVAVQFSGSGYDDMFGEVTEACQKAGLSYVWTIGEYGSESQSNGKAWKPGIPNEIEFLLLEDKPGVALDVIAATAKRGIEAVNDLVQTVSSATKVGKIELEPGFVEAYEAYIENSETDDDDYGMSR